MDDPASDAAPRLLARAELEAEMTAAKARIAISLVLFTLVQVLLVSGALPPLDLPAQRAFVVRQMESARMFLAALVLVGGVAYLAVRRAWVPRWRPFLTSTADAALIVGNIAHTLLAADLPGGLIAVLPVTFAVPLVLASVAVHYRPALQLYITVLYGAGLVGILVLLGTGTAAERAAALQGAGVLFGSPPNVVRVVMLLLLGGVLVLVTLRGRALLRRAVDESVHRASLARFLPPEISSLIGSAAAAALRDGRRQVATVVFVDMRDSTARAETLDPRALSVFISAFRRRITQAAHAHGGVIDKFVGDGALVVFGVPDPKLNDAARALAFASDLSHRVRRWNRKRRFEPPVCIGVGVHTGEVYCGLVGDESRIEFTVLGDAVNVAARLEDATKRYDRTILASDAAIGAAGATGWAEVGSEALRGRGQETRIMAAGDEPGLQ
jgi:adenylate cyclase